MGRPDPPKEDTVGESRKYRKFTSQQKTELVLASLRGPKSVAQPARENDVSETLLRTWREHFLAAGAQRLEGKAERTEADELRKQITRLERALGRKTMELEISGELLRGWE
jgi:transposase